MIEVRRAERADIHVLANILGRAFEVDPIARYVFPNPHWRRVVLPRSFRLQLASNYLPRGEAYTTTDRKGVALWMPPTTRAPNWRERFAHIAFVPFFGGRRQAMHHLTLALERHHPSEKHYYLATIGTDPEHQGQGIGSALINVVLQRCDAESVPAYLESSRVENVDFYRRFGFAIREIIEAPETGPDGPRLYLMWRAPLGPR